MPAHPKPQSSSACVPGTHRVFTTLTSVTSPFAEKCSFRRASVRYLGRPFTQSRDDGSRAGWGPSGALACASGCTSTGLPDAGTALPGAMLLQGLQALLSAAAPYKGCYSQRPNTLLKLQSFVFKNVPINAGAESLCARVRVQDSPPWELCVLPMFCLC